MNEITETEDTVPLRSHWSVNNSIQEETRRVEPIRCNDVVCTGGLTNQIPEHKSLSELVVTYSNSLSPFQLCVLRLVAHLQGIELTLLKKVNTFAEIFNLIKQKLPTKAVSLVLIVFRKFSLPPTHVDLLEKYVDEQYQLEENMSTDFLLTMEEIVMNTDDSTYCNFKELVRTKFLVTYNPINIDDRACFLEALVTNDLLTPFSLPHYFQWIELAKFPTQLEKLRSFCKRHGLQEPVVKDKSSPVSTGATPIQVSDSSLVPPPTLHCQVTSDGSGLVMAESSHPTHLPQPFVNSNSSHNDVTGGKKDGDCSDILESQQPSGNNTPANGLITQSRPVPCSEGNEATVRGGSESLDHFTQYGTCTRELLPNLNTTSINDYDADSMTSLVDSSTVQTVHHRRKKLFGNMTVKEICCCLLSLLLSIILLATFLILWLTYTYITLSNPSTVIEHVGFNSTNLLGCYKASITQSIYIAAELGEDLEYDSHIFIMNQTNLSITSIELDSRSTVLKQTDSINFPVNYHYDNDPIYTATSTGYLKYNVTANGHTSSSCASQFFLFHSEASYKPFVHSTDRYPLGRYVQSSRCIHTTSSLPTYMSFTFTLPDEGLYYVAAFVAKGVQLNITIEGSVTSYTIPPSLHEQCWLTSDTRDCTIDMSQVHGQEVCMLSQSDSESSYLVNISVVMVKWYKSFRGKSYISVLLISLLLVILVFIFCIFKCLKAKR